MHIFSTLPGNWAKTFCRCLVSDTYCTLCGRVGQQGIDLCRACQAQLKARLYTDAMGVKTILCVACGEEIAVFSATCCATGNPDPSIIASGSHNPYISLNNQAEAASPNISDFCPDCTEMQGRFLHRIVAPYRYAYPLDEQVKRCKYRNDRQMSRVLGTLLAFAVDTDCEPPLPDVLVPMPLHRLRLRERGFNQAHDIARWCGRYLNIEVSANLASRLVDTGSLAGLSRAERQHRILGAFRASERVVDKHVAIVDDVLTTGASARELAREIYDSGAASVELWVLARTSRLRMGS